MVGTTTLNTSMRKTHGDRPDDVLVFMEVSKHDDECEGQVKSSESSLAEHQWRREVEIPKKDSKTSRKETEREGGRELTVLYPSLPQSINRHSLHLISLSIACLFFTYIGNDDIYTVIRATFKLTRKNIHDNDPRYFLRRMHAKQCTVCTCGLC